MFGFLAKNLCSTPRDVPFDLSNCVALIVRSEGQYAIMTLLYPKPAARMAGGDAGRVEPESATVNEGSSPSSEESGKEEEEVGSWGDQYS